MPIKKGKSSGKGETSGQYYKRISDPDILEKVLAVLDDFEQVLRDDAKSMVSLKAAYKKPGYQIGIFSGNEWDNVAGPSLLEAFVEYYLLISE